MCLFCSNKDHIPCFTDTMLILTLEMLKHFYFVLWEIKGRTDDGYTSSVKKVSQLLRMQFKYSFVHNGLHAKYDCSYTR